MFHQYHCCDAACTYKTTAHTETEADKQLVQDGGYDQDKKTKCPLCKKDSLVFIPELSRKET